MFHGEAGSGDVVDIHKVVVALNLAEWASTEDDG